MQPGGSGTVVMQCRTSKRASWAAQLAHDARLSRVLVYKQARPAPPRPPLPLHTYRHSCAQLLDAAELDCMQLSP